MSNTAIERRPAEDDQGADRQQLIIDAAERCFVRTGFHRTTMQDIAAEANMSPGNLYRYFPSKDAMIAALTERDRAQMTREFSEMPEEEDLLSAFAAMGRRRLEERPRSKAILCLEIWAEATRNQGVADRQAEFERDVVTRIRGLLENAKSRGQIASTVSPADAARFIVTLAHGLFVRRAVGRDFDPKHEVGYALAVIGAIMSGAVAFNPSLQAS
jgi:AcrR family transcriptional regulator